GIISMWALTKMLHNSDRYQRGIASNADLSEINSTLEMIFANSASCSKSGLVGKVISPFPIVAPGFELGAIHVPGSTGVGAPFIETGKTYGNRDVEIILITDMGSAGAGVPPDSTIYLSTLNINVPVRGKALTYQKPVVTT